MRPTLAPPPPTTTRPKAPPTTTLPDLDCSPLGRYLLHPQHTLAQVARTLAHHAAGILHRDGLWLLLLAVILLATRLALARWRAARLHQGARLVEILPPPQVDPDGAQALWRNLAGLLRQHRLLQGRPHVGFEYRWSPGGLTIALWLPGMLAPRLVERAVEAAWPGARTRTRMPAPPPLPVGHRVGGGALRLTQPEWYALRGQAEHPTDPLRALLGAAEELGAGESAVVQVLVRPARGRRLARLRRVARALRRSQHPTRPGRLVDLLNPTTTSMSSRRAYTDDPARHADVQAITRKAAGPGFEVLIRYGVATSVEHHVRGRLRARAHALAAAFATYAGRNRLTRTHHPSRLAARALRERRLGRGMLLGLDELAALAHLPWDRGVPGLERAGARSVAPPPSAPREGKVLGDADTGPTRPIALDPVDARQHTHLVGATGSGKSTLLGNLVLQDVDAGRGVVLVDPAKGDLVRELLNRLPRSAKDRLVLLDPDERAAPPTLNVLEGPDPELATDHLLSSLRRVFSSSWGPRTDDVLRTACLTLLHHGPATLADVPRLLTDPGFRHRLTTGLHDDLLRGFWDGYDQLTPSGHAQLVGPALARLRAFLLRSFVRDVVGSTTSSFTMTEVLDGGILLARLPKGVLGEDTARLLGAFVIAKTWQATADRATRGEQARTDAALYLDEFHNVLHLPYPYEELLAEARGYRLALTLAHHNLAQLPRELHEAISANARTKVYFTGSPEDAHVLERHVAPELGAHDLAHLGKFQAAARLVVGGVEVPACTLTTRPLPDAVSGRAAELRAAARARIGRTRARRRTEQQRRQTVEDQPRLPRPPRSARTRRTAPSAARPGASGAAAATTIASSPAEPRRQQGAGRQAGQDQR
jgi:Type IV secretion-system coupling protein DNA-binding domain